MHKGERWQQPYREAQGRRATGASCCHCWWFGAIRRHSHWVSGLKPVPRYKHVYIFVWLRYIWDILLWEQHYQGCSKWMSTLSICSLLTSDRFFFQVSRTYPVNFSWLGLYCWRIMVVLGGHFQKLLGANGASKVSAYVTHAVFPKRSWERFEHDNGGEQVSTYLFSFL